MRKRNENEIKARIEYAHKHTLQEFAEHFNLTLASARQFYYHNRLSAMNGVKSFNNRMKDIITKDVWEDYAKNHTIPECLSHFKICRTSLYTLEKEYKVYALRRNGSTAKSIEDRQIKRTGEMQDMIRFLSNKFTYASIGRVFGYTKERVRQICQEGE